MLFDDAVRELFHIISQKILILRDFLSFRNGDGILKTKFPSVSKSDIPPKLSHLILWKCCHVVHFPLSSFIMYIQKSWKLSWCTFRIFWLPQEPSLDICGYPEKIRMISSHNPMAFFSSSPVNHMADWYSGRNPPKSYFTLKTQIKVPATQNILNTHITQKIDLATCTFFSMVPCIHGKCW